MGVALNEMQQKVDILMLSRLRVLDENGNAEVIASFWRERPVVFIFLRHFSCIACRAHVDQIWKRKEEFAKSKTNIIFVGNGAPRVIKDFKNDLQVQDAAIYTDPTMETFDACGFSRNPIRLFDPRGVVQALSLKAQGHTQGPWDKESGSDFQMGGVVAFKPPGKVVYHFIAEYLGDHDNPNNWPTV